MLQRPRDLLTAHDLNLTSSTPSFGRFRCYLHHQRDPDYDLVVAPLQLVHNCQNLFNSIDNTWNTTQAELVAKWKRLHSARRLHRHKRSMVKKSTSLKISVLLPEPASAGDPQRGITSSAPCHEDALVVEDIRSHSEGPEQCLGEFSVCTEKLNTQIEGFKFGDLSQEQPRSAGPMESNRKAGGAKRPGLCQLNHEGERGLTPDQYVAIKKREAVALVMAAFTRWLDKRLAVTSYVYGASDASDASEGSAAGSSGASHGSSSSGQGQSSRSTRTKRRLGGDDQDNSSAGGNEDDPDRGGSKRAKKDDESERKFACPFFKHDPKAHSKHRSCSGPGWTSLHRLKEHLYRVHRLPKHTCPRCNEPFEDARDLAEHIRADVPCEKLEIVPVPQGIDETTEAELKVRKKSCPGMTDEQRWRDIYMILFPKANPKAIPSPYYDASDSLGQAQRAEEWRRVKKRIQKELPKVVQKKVERSFEKVGADVLTGLADIVRDGLLEIFKDSPHDDRSPSVTPAATPRAPTPSFPAARDQSAISIDGTQDTSLDLSYYFDTEMPMPMPFFGGLDDLDFSAFGNPVECLDKGSDSGYASTGTGRDGFVEAEA